MIRRPLAILTALSLLLAGPACLNIDTAWQFGAAVCNGAVAALSNNDDDSDSSNGNGNEGTPGAPTGLEATAAGEDQIDLRWMAPASNGGSDITGYRIEYRQGDGDWMPPAADTESTDTEYEHTGLTAATQYSYRVSAINANGTGPASEEATATTVAMGTPDAPTGLEASAVADDQIDLSWTAPADDGGSAITGYQIEYRQGSGDWRDAATDTGTTDTEYEHTGLTAETEYSYRVSAINTNGTGVASAEAMATTAALGTPDAPTNLTATVAAEDQIDLSWTAPADDGGSAITGYRVEYRQGSGDWMDAATDTGTTDTEYEHSGLTADTDYSYRVSAINANGTGVASSVATATTTVDPNGDKDSDGVINSMDVDDDNDGLIEIASRAELENIAHNLAGSSYTATAGTAGVTTGAPTEATPNCDTASGGVYLCGYELANDIDLDGFGSDNVTCDSSNKWTPIGGCGSDGTCGETSSNDDEPFTAIFEGNGFTISDLCIEAVVESPTDRHDILGLFGHLIGATVRNLAIADLYVEASFTGGIAVDREDDNRLGGLAGYIMGDTVILNVAAEDSDSDIDLQGATTDDVDNVGGLVGQQTGGSITASYATGTADGGAGNNDRVGGLLATTGVNVIASYGFGDVSGQENAGAAGTTKPGGVTEAAHLSGDSMDTTTYAGAAWSSDVWDFGDNTQDNTQAPALLYVDGYTRGDGPDGMANTDDDTHTYSCADTSFPDSLMVTCGTTLLPGQGR